MKCLENKAISDGQGVEPTIVKENVSTALVDGNNILGRSTNQIELPIKSKSESIMVFTRSITVMIFFSSHCAVGPAIGKFAMDLAMKKAKDSGIGLVSVRGKVPCVSKDSTRN